MERWVGAWTEASLRCEMMWVSAAPRIACARRHQRSRVTLTADRSSAEVLDREPLELEAPSRALYTRLVQSEYPLVAFRKAGVLYWAGTDHLGGTVRTLDAGFNVVDSSRYVAFGADRDPATALKTDRKFTGQTQDRVSGLYFYKSRYYDQALGRFVQPDSVVPSPKNPQLLNRYSYVLNNPVTYTDPSGHSAESGWDHGSYDSWGEPDYESSGPNDPGYAQGESWETGGGYESGESGSSGGYSSGGSYESSGPNDPGYTQGESWETGGGHDSGSSAAGQTSSGTAQPELGSILLHNAPPRSPIFHMFDWTLPNDALGLAAGVLGGGRVRVEGGTIVFEDVGGEVDATIRQWNDGEDAAITIGRVILYTKTFDLSTRQDAWLRAHEEAHVRQAQATGLFYLPAYLALKVGATTHDDHPMERRANNYANAYWKDYHRPATAPPAYMRAI